MRSIKRKKLPITTGANESHRVMGIDCPSINCEAAALKNGSRAEENTIFIITFRKESRCKIQYNLLPYLVYPKFLSPLTVCVKETATAANETLLVTWPNAWHTATGISNFSRLPSIGYTKQQPYAKIDYMKSS